MSRQLTETDESGELDNVVDEETQDQTIKPLASFGLLTDIQYADCDDGMSFDKARHRYYRNSLKLVRQAVEHWKKYEEESKQKLKFVIQLGDLIDGKSIPLPGSSLGAMNTVLSELNKLVDDEPAQPSTPPRLLHIGGNHEMYNFKRKELLELPLNTSRFLDSNKSNSPNLANYYSYEVSDKLRLICLDFYEFSALGLDEDDPVYLQAMKLLRTHNKNEDLNSCQGLRGHAQRFTKFNGSLSPTQMAWLADELQKSKQSNKKVIVCGHLPIHAKASDPMCLAWNSKELLELLWSYHDCVITYFAGHDHQGGYFRDKCNIHHITYNAILETPANSNAFAIVKVYDNKVSVEGVGVIGYYEIYF